MGVFCFYLCEKTEKLLSKTPFQGCLYNKQPCGTESVSPSGAEGSFFFFFHYAGK
jgi:hypothetical protein